jgi:hypothetical protein
VTAPVSQLHVALVPAHDRLLLRMATARQQEVRLWMTRRFVKVLWPVLWEALQTDPAVAGHADGNVRREMLSFQHQRAVQDTAFTREYKATAGTTPLTQTPLLLTRARCRIVDDKHVGLELITARNRSFQLTLDRKTIHSLCKLIVDCAAKAEWDLDLPMAQADAAVDRGSRTIN